MEPMFPPYHLHHPLANCPTFYKPACFAYKDMDYSNVVLRSPSPLTLQGESEFDTFFSSVNRRSPGFAPSSTDVEPPASSQCAKYGPTAATPIHIDTVSSVPSNASSPSSSFPTTPQDPFQGHLREKEVPATHWGLEDSTEGAGVNTFLSVYTTLGDVNPWKDSLPSHEDPLLSFPAAPSPFAPSHSATNASFDDLSLDAEFSRLLRELSQASSQVSTTANADSKLEAAGEASALFLNNSGPSLDPQFERSPLFNNRNSQEHPSLNLNNTHHDFAPLQPCPPACPPFRQEMSCATTRPSILQREHHTIGDPNTSHCCRGHLESMHAYSASSTAAPPGQFNVAPTIPLLSVMSFKQQLPYASSSSQTLPQTHSKLLTAVKNSCIEAAPYTLEPPSSAASSSASSPSTSNKRGTKNAYSVAHIHDYMWVNFDKSEPREGGVGAPGKHWKEKFCTLEEAKHHLANSKAARARVTKEIRDGEKRRKATDKRRDIFCFMKGCGQMFGRVEKLGRHLATTKGVHQDMKPWICPHQGCDKHYLDQNSLRAHMYLHREKGYPNLPFPYAWNSPYPGVLDAAFKAYKKAESQIQKEPEISITV